MNKNHNISLFKYFFTALILILSIATVNAQFEHKVTVNLSGAFTIPDIAASDALYGYGMGVDGGLQFNQNTHLSIIANIRYYANFANDEHPDAYVDNFALGGGLKFNLAPRAVVNPYLFGEVNINFLWFEDYYIYLEPRIDQYGHLAYGEYDNKFATSIGGYGGGGLDFKLGKNFALYIQMGVYYTNYDTRIDAYIQTGLRINLLKSKTI